MSKNLDKLPKVQTASDGKFYEMLADSKISW